MFWWALLGVAVLAGAGTGLIVHTRQPRVFIFGMGLLAASVYSFVFALAIPFLQSHLL